MYQSDDTPIWLRLRRRRFHHGRPNTNRLPRQDRPQPAHFCLGRRRHDSLIPQMKFEKETKAKRQNVEARCDQTRQSNRPCSVVFETERVRVESLCKTWDFGPADRIGRSLKDLPSRRSSKHRPSNPSATELSGIPVGAKARTMHDLLCDGVRAKGGKL